MPSDLHARRLLVFLVVAAAALTVLIITPFWVALFLAAVLAATFRRPMEALARLFRGRRSLAAAAITLGVLLVIILPIAGFGAVVVDHVLAGIRWFREALASDGIQGLLERLPGPLERFAQRVLESLPDPQQQLQQLAGSQGGQAAAAVGGLLAATGGAVFQTVMMLIALFFFLTDGQRLVAWLEARVPLRPGQFRQLVEDFKRTSVSVLVATVATAGIQTVTGLVGYLIARAPNPIFLTFATFVVALIPAIGGTAMVLVVGVVMLATGHVLAGIFLLIWGSVVVSLIDNIARPYLLKGGMELHGGVVFFALLGGLSVFGGVGLILGPLVLTFLLTAVNLYRREFGGPGEGAGPDALAGHATGSVAPGAQASAPAGGADVAGARPAPAAGRDAP
jgi:predicted PurR-regulated permease PerM